MLKMDIEYNEGILYVRLKGDLDKRNCYKINNYLNPVIKKHGIKTLVYNLANLKSIDNSGMDAITLSKCLIKSNKGNIYVCNINSGIKKLIKDLKIKEIINEGFLKERIS